MYLCICWYVCSTANKNDIDDRDERVKLQIFHKRKGNTILHEMKKPPTHLAVFGQIVIGGLNGVIRQDAGICLACLYPELFPVRILYYGYRFRV